MQRYNVALLIALIIMGAFAIREIGNLYGKAYHERFLPEQLAWIEELDKIVFFFSDRGGDVYSMINYVMIVGGLLFISLLRKLGKQLPTLETEVPVKIVEEGKNPFFVGVPDWKKTENVQEGDLQESSDVQKTADKRTHPGGSPELGQERKRRKKDPIDVYAM